jgi:class 3 adenylate cyclase
LFAGLFLAMPRKREYFSFAAFSLLSAFYAALFSRFLPIYEDYQLRIGLQFLFSSLSLTCIPWMTADFLRLPDEQRSAIRAGGFSLALVCFGAALILGRSDQRIALYQLTSSWLPLLVGIPSLAAIARHWWMLDRGISHRRVQLAFFGACLSIGVVSWSWLAPAVLQFNKFIFPELVDLAVFAGLSSSMIFELRASTRRSDRVGKILPKWLAGHLASKKSSVKLEVPMIVLKVDTVGYTRTLELVGRENHEVVHKDIRDALAPLLDTFGAQKLSDGGDGGLFGWDCPTSETELRNTIQSVINACRGLADVNGAKIKFRMGMAAGLVRCEMRDGDISFLGEPLNIATRLESVAEPGIPMVDQSLVDILGEEKLGSWVETELKGVLYRSRPLRLVA